MENLDFLPIWGVFIFMVGTVLVAAEIGFRIGIWLQDNDSDSGEARMTGAVVGSMLGLVGFLMAFSIGIAINQHGERKGMVVSEANAVGTAWLRAGFLDEADTVSMRKLLNDYVKVRLDAADQLIDLQEAIARSETIHRALWKIVEGSVKRGNESDIMTTVAQAINDVINIHSLRITAATKRLPIILGVVLIAATILSFLLVGVASSADRKRDIAAVSLFALAFIAVMIIMVDLDRPQQGMLTVSQTAMMNLQRQIDPLNQ